MTLTPQEQKDLARFFSKRSDLLNPTAIRLKAGLSIPSALIGTGLPEWEAIIEQAEARDRLHLVANAVAKTGAKDANLVSVCQILNDGPSPWPQIANVMRTSGVILCAAGVAGILIGFIGYGLKVNSTSTDVASYEGSVSLTQALTSTKSEGLQPQPVRVNQRLEMPAAGALTKNSLQPQPKTQSMRPVEGVMKEKPKSRGLLTERCAAEKGQVIGYFHWGPEEKGAPDKELIVERYVNVRADYPNLKNEYSVKAAIRCVLSKGERLQLSDDAILVAGGHYWVPLTAGDLVQG